MREKKLFLSVAHNISISSSKKSERQKTASYI